MRKQTKNTVVRAATILMPTPHKDFPKNELSQKRIFPKAIKFSL